MAVLWQLLWRRLDSMNAPSPIGGPVLDARGRPCRSAWSNSPGTEDRYKRMRDPRHEAGRHRVDGVGHDGEDALVAGRRGQRATGHAPDPTADRAGEALRGPSSLVGLYRWLGVVHSGHTRDLSRARAHRARRTAPAASVAQHLDRPSG